MSLEKEICVWISCIHTNIVYIVYTYRYSIKTPPGGFRWKIEIFSSKIFLTKVLFLETKASELTCNSSNYTNLSFMGEPTVNLLEGTVCCSINYTRTETRWYKTEEDANAGRNGSYNHDDYVIAREKAYKDSTSVTFDIREWNTGKAVWKR